MNSSILEIVTAEISFLPCFSKHKTYPKNNTYLEFLDIDIDVESVENDEDGFNSVVSLDFHQ